MATSGSLCPRTARPSACAKWPRGWLGVACMAHGSCGADAAIDHEGRLSAPGGVRGSFCGRRRLPCSASADLPSPHLLSSSFSPSFLLLAAAPPGSFHVFLNLSFVISASSYVISASSEVITTSSPHASPPHGAKFLHGRAALRAEIRQHVAGQTLEQHVAGQKPLNECLCERGKGGGAFEAAERCAVKIASNFHHRIFHQRRGSSEDQLMGPISWAPKTKIQISVTKDSKRRRP